MTDSGIVHARESKEFILLMALLMSVTAMTIDAILPALGMIGADLRAVHPNQAQFIISFIFAGMALGQLVCGPLSDAIGRKTILYGALSIFLVGSLLCYFASGMDQMLLGRFMQGLGVSGPYVASVSIVRDRHSGRAMAKIMSLIMMVFIMVPTIAPALGQGILFIASWRAIFIFYVLYAAVILMWVMMRVPETLPREKRIAFRPANIWNGAREVVGNRVTLGYMICAGCVFGSLIGYLNSCQQIFQVQFKVGDMFAVYFGGLALMLGVSSLSNAAMVERLGMRYICVRAVLAIIALSSLFLALHMVVEIKLWMFLIYAASLFFCFGLLFGNLNALAMEPMGHIAGIASAIIGSSSSILSIVLGTTIGQLYNGTLVPIVTGFLILNLMTLLAMRFAQGGRRIS